MYVAIACGSSLVSSCSLCLWLSSPIWDGSSSLSVIVDADSCLSCVLSSIGDEDRVCREGEPRRRERPLRVLFARSLSMLSGVLLMVSLRNDSRCSCRCCASCVKYFLSCLGVLLVILSGP